MDFFFLYWKKYDKIIAYLLINHALMLGYETFTAIHSQIDKIPVVDNNENIFRLFYIYFNEVYDDTIYQKLIQNASIHKLSYKGEIRKEVNGKLTFYGMLMEKYNSQKFDT